MDSWADNVSENLSMVAFLAQSEKYFTTIDKNTTTSEAIALLYNAYVILKKGLMVHSRRNQWKILVMAIQENRSV